LVSQLPTEEHIDRSKGVLLRQKMSWERERLRKAELRGRGPVAAVSRLQ
jgi:hypothetical protein